MIISIRSVLKLSIIYLKNNSGLANGLARCIFAFASPLFMGVFVSVMVLLCKYFKFEFLVNKKLIQQK